MTPIHLYIYKDTKVKNRIFRLVCFSNEIDMLKQICKCLFRFVGRISGCLFHFSLPLFSCFAVCLQVYFAGSQAMSAISTPQIRYIEKTSIAHSSNSFPISFRFEIYGADFDKSFWQLNLFITHLEGLLRNAGF